MGGILEDIEKRIDEERARAQFKKAQEAERKAKEAAKAAEAARRRNSGSLFF